MLENYYKEFYIEKELNKKTTSKFICDYIKDNLLMIILSMVYYSLLIVILNNTGHFFYIYAMVTSMLFLLFALTIFPTLIAPWFFTYIELEDEKLEEEIKDVCEKLKFPLNKIRVQVESTNSKKVNAYFFGFGNNK